MLGWSKTIRSLHVTFSATCSRSCLLQVNGSDGRLVWYPIWFTVDYFLCCWCRPQESGSPKDSIPLWIKRDVKQNEFAMRSVLVELGILEIEWTLPPLRGTCGAGQIWPKSPWRFSPCASLMGEPTCTHTNTAYNICSLEVWTAYIYNTPASSLSRVQYNWTNIGEAVGNNLKVDLCKVDGVFQLQRPNPE